MKKTLFLLVLTISSLSFSNYNALINKYNKLENEFVELLNLETTEFEKIVDSYNQINAKIKEKEEFKISIQNRINNLEEANVFKYFKDEYNKIVSEYKTLITTLDEEIKELKNSQKRNNLVIDMKRGVK